MQCLKHMTRTAESKWTVWIDADTFVHSPISYKQFEDLLPDDKWITFRRQRYVAHKLGPSVVFMV